MLGVTSREKYFPRRSGVELTGGEGNVGLSVAIGHTVQVLWPPEISAHILRHAKKQAERALGTSEIAAAITVPAYFDDPHRRATLDAARLAGVDVCGALVDEPQAAAIAFAPHLGLRDREPILVADWGGGTLDLTVLASEGRNWLQLNIDGHLTLACDDIDRELMRHIVSRAALPDELLQHAAIRWELIKAMPPSTRTELPVPAELDDLVMRCLRKEPGERVQAVDALARALAAVPFAERWSDVQAAQWWERHYPRPPRA